MEMDWTCSAYFTNFAAKSSPQLDLRTGETGKPKETWRRTVEKEMKEQGWTWGYLERCATDR